MCTLQFKKFIRISVSLILAIIVVKLISFFIPMIIPIMGYTLLFLLVFGFFLEIIKRIVYLWIFKR